MPHPLSRVKPNAEIEVGVNALAQRPQFVPQIMRVIAYWAHIDGDMATIFSNFLRTDIEVGTAVYQAFNGAEARRVAMFAAAEKALPEWQQIALRAVWNATKASRDQRDKFAHHVWATSEELPDALLLMHSSVVVARNVSHRQRSEHLPNGRGVIAPKDLDRSKVFVYRQKDFDRAAEEAGAASFLVMLLYTAIGQNWHEVGRRQLWNEPRFQRAVQPLILEKSPELSISGADRPDTAIPFSPPLSCSLYKV
jgi:hypothetical protein